MAFKSPEEQRALFDEERAIMRRFLDDVHAANLISGLLPLSVTDIAYGLFPSFGQADARSRSATALGSSAAERDTSPRLMLLKRLRRPLVLEALRDNCKMKCLPSGNNNNEQVSRDFALPS